METLIEFDQVSFCYEEDRIALEKCSVSLCSNQKVAVLGNNGAGKSTFFLLCNGILRPTSGTIRWQGAPLSTHKKDLNALRQKVGLVFQDPDVQILAGTVQEEVSFGPMNLGWRIEKVRQSVERALAQFHLDSLRHRAPQFLSGGEKKRVSLADVLAMEPQLILLDEPASSLDPQNRQLLEENLMRLSEKGIGMVIATHDVDFAWRWAERILLFHHGRLVADTTPEIAFSDKELLQQCGLEQPILYQVSQQIGLQNPLHRIEDLRQYQFDVHPIMCKKE